MTLAVGASASEQARRAVLVDFDRAVLDVKPDRCGHLDVGGQPDAELHDVATLAPRCLLGAKVVIAGSGQDGVERLGVLAGVIVGPGGRGQRKGVGAQVVAAA